MDTEAFLHQLEYSLANNDKKLFAKTIYELPADVIVGFTKEEFLRIIYISNYFSSQKMDRLSNFLETKGSFFLKNALKGIDELNNSLLSKFYYSLYVSLYETNKEKLKRVLVNNVVACGMLAEMGVESRENLETAGSLCGFAKELFLKTSPNYAHVLINESNIRAKLAEMGIQSRENLENAVNLCSNSRKILSKKSENYALALVNESNARQTLANMGINCKKNLEVAVDLYANSRKLLPQISQDYACALMNEGNARQMLAEMGIQSIENLEISVSLCEDARGIFPKTSSSYASTLMNEGNARQALAEIGINSRENLETSISFYSNAREILPQKSAFYASTLTNEGSARYALAEIGIDSKENLETAVSLYNNSREILSKKSSSYALARMNEGNARLKLAEMGVNNRKNIEIAVGLYGDSREVFSKTSADYAGALMNEGNARQMLAEMGIQSIKNLEISVSLCEDVREIFPKKSSSYASALMNEGNARQALAEIGINSRENLETSISFYSNAREIFPNKSVFYARALMNEGSARKKLASMNIENRENFEKSKNLYLKCVLILEELGDGWTYSVALLNFNDLLKDNFYKTGEKKHLEEWERNLGDIEEKIKERDIRYKELLMARVHEIRASLLEFDGKQGISDASFEYYEAYELSKEPFYKFMKEFCQARSDNKSFCKIVSDWKEYEKKGIFLDYYDYTVFECHLENALKKSIFRKDEMELARKKLEDIGNRTQIKIIKDRVSAYIFLMNSIDFCFEQGSYEDAAENVRKACKIFHEFDDKPGCEMCECFHEALLENRNPDSWRNVVQKIFLSGEFSSNFYRLLCNYSDRERTNILQVLPLQILEKTSRIEEKVDNIQKTLDQISSECISIKGQIEEGFDGTAAELRQIKGKIDNIEQDLDNLMRISNDVGGKEGDCIREFASQMLELMKKEDSEALKRFSEKIVQNSSSIIEIIEAANIPEKEKAEAKSKLADLKKIPGILKEKAKSFSVDVTKDVAVSLASGEIIKLLIPVLSTAIFGVPIPSQVVGILLEAIRN